MLRPPFEKAQLATINIQRKESGQVSKDKGVFILLNLNHFLYKNKQNKKEVRQDGTTEQKSGHALAIRWTPDQAPP